MNDHFTFDSRIAVIGLALRAPDASNSNEFWNNLISGKISNSVTKPIGELTGLQPRQIRRIKEFDRHLFNMQPAEATLTDPQQRAFLELTWEAFEDAGLDPMSIDGCVGVFAGCGRDDYRRQLLDKNPMYEETHGRHQIEFGNERDYFATNVAYRFNLKGPSFTVQSACSTSLVAIHLAVRSLLTGECNFAVAGGLTIQIPEASGYHYQEGGICSIDGLCRPFTEASNGTVPASGGGVVILARASDVDIYGVNPYAYVVGTAINNDGGRKMNFAAPTVSGHVAVINEALDFAGLQQEQIGFVQAHGTGTQLGDEIELAALRQTYGHLSSRSTDRCAVGSIKANIGHADAGAGVLGFITSVLALNERVIPQTPNQRGDGRDMLRTDEGPRLFIPRTNIPWEDKQIMRAAVSSLGVGGTNAHVVLEEAPKKRLSSLPEDQPTVLALSAATPSALKDVAVRMVNFLDSDKEKLPLATITSTLWHRRTHLRYRWAASVKTRADAAEKLRNMIALAGTATAFPTSPKLGVLLPGQGVVIDRSYVELLNASTAFRAEFYRLRNIILGYGGPDVIEYESMIADDPKLNDTEFVQPLLLALQLSLLRSLRLDEVKPAIVVGHSIGELLAAIFGGLLNDEDAAAAIVMRSKLMAASPVGSMVTVRSTEEEAHRLCSDFDLEIASKLSSSVNVLSGSKAAVQELIKLATSKKMTAIPLPVTKAFHSRAMVNAASEFAHFIGRFTLKAPSVAVASNIDGKPLQPATAIDPQYWGDQIRRCVDLRAAIDTLVSVSPNGILDLGPGDGLTNLVRERVHNQVEKPAFFVVAPTRSKKAENVGLDVLAAMWESGFDIQLPIDKYQAVRLPTYPFENTEYWPQRNEVDGLFSSDNDREPKALPVSNDAGLKDNSIDTVNISVLAKVRRIWLEAFGYDDIGDEDEFFDIGGTSIHATQILRRVSTELNVKIRLHDLYDYPILREFSRYIEDRLEVQHSV
jgi:acyl transferase domain-containing protein